MDSWIQIISLFLANAGLILWFRAESRADWRHLDNKFDKMLEESKNEMKDFHSRLIILEERYLQIISKK